MVNGAKEGRAVLLASGDEEVVPQRVELVSMAHERRALRGDTYKGHKTKQMLLIGNHSFFSDPAKCGVRGRPPVLRVARALGSEGVVYHSATKLFQFAPPMSSDGVTFTAALPTLAHVAVKS